MKRILVVAAVIRRDGRILIAQRPRDKHMGGLWEFPGGKVEPGEDVRHALVRELEEELGITASACAPLIRITHDYPDKAVCLDVWEVTAFAGEPHGREGQSVRWVTEAELPAFDYPAANRPIVTAARLPGRYFISPPDLDAAGYRDWAEGALARGARLLLLRAPALAEAAHDALARELLARCRAAGAQLLLHGDPGRLAGVAADGVHLPAARLAALAARPDIGPRWLAASVHDAAELALAARAGVDFVTLSPVRETASHPGQAGMGWDAFAALVAKAQVPVYALGGMTADDVAAARAAGAQGVAGIHGL
ncbi:MAG TPA: Nudix family hydrolase [Moraxellaceae bacterium]|nr:Nudix family hydrolase [Moraxellaceae bacterium]